MRICVCVCVCDCVICVHGCAFVQYVVIVCANDLQTMSFQAFMCWGMHVCMYMYTVVVSTMCICHTCTWVAAGFSQFSKKNSQAFPHV